MVHVLWSISSFECDITAVRRRHCSLSVKTCIYYLHEKSEENMAQKNVPLWHKNEGANLPYSVLYNSVNHMKID